MEVKVVGQKKIDMLGFEATLYNAIVKAVEDLPCSI